MRCPDLLVPGGTSVTLVVTITFPGDSPIFWTTGCDSRAFGSCTVVMNGDRNVGIGVGCSICGVDPLHQDLSVRAASPEPPEPEQLVVGTGPSLHDPKGGLRAEEAERHAVAAIAEREDLAWMEAMPADVGQAIRRRREEAFPRVLGSNPVQRWIERREIVE